MKWFSLFHHFLFHDHIHVNVLDIFSLWRFCVLAENEMGTQLPSLSNITLLQSQKKCTCEVKYWYECTQEKQGKGESLLTTKASPAVFPTNDYGFY